MDMQTEILTHFHDLVRRWQRAIDNNLTQEVKDAQIALTRMGAIYHYPQGWTLEV